MFSWLFGKSAEEQRNDFESKINKIATSLIKNAEQNTPESNMELASLLDPSKCNDYTLFLGDELDKRFTKVELNELNTQIYLVKRAKKSEKNNLNINNYRSGDKKYSKQELCNKIAGHYVRIFNLISAILSAINPEKNVYARRIKALYEVSTNNSEEGYVKICKSDDTQQDNLLYPSNINELPGMYNLLRLYYFYLMQDAPNSEQRNNIEKEFAKLSESFTQLFTSAGTPVVPLLVQEVENSLNRSMNNLEKTTDTEQNQRINELYEIIGDLKAEISKLKKNNKNEQMVEKINNILNNKLPMYQGTPSQKINALEEDVVQLTNKNNNLKNMENMKNIENMKNMNNLNNLNNLNKLENTKSKDTGTQLETHNIKENKINKNLQRVPSSRNQNGGDQKNNNNTEINNNEINNTELNNTEINNTELNNTELNNTEINNTELNKQEYIEKSVIDRFNEFVDNLSTTKGAKKMDELKLRPKTVEELSTFKCSSTPSNIVIKINDSKFKEFKKIYEDMKSYYLSASTNLMDILEKYLVESNGSNGSNGADDFKIKSLTNEQLNNAQSKVTEGLSTYYIKCNEMYQSAFISLAKALEEEQ
jgi:hypothetical protein